MPQFMYDGQAMSRKFPFNAGKSENGGGEFLPHVDYFIDKRLNILFYRVIVSSQRVCYGIC